MQAPPSLQRGGAQSPLHSACTVHALWGNYVVNMGTKESKAIYFDVSHLYERGRQASKQTQRVIRTFDPFVGIQSYSNGILPEVEIGGALYIVIDCSGTK